VLIKAGRGLAAAHAAGLIHRDFKPANLLVGDDGRVVVTDFGLARAGQAGDSSPDERASLPGSALAASITRTGAVQGTPAYMAPEQQVGAADARADQFSFCVTLHEAVFGVHPFLPHPTPAASSDEARPPAPAQAARLADDVPGWLHRAVRRGLAERPEDRYPTMDALLAVLNHEPARRRGRLRWIAAIAAVVAAATGVAAYLSTRDPASAPCAGAAGQIAATWNPATRAQMRGAFAVTGLAYAADAWRRVEPMIDAYAAQWTAMHGEACRATRVRGEQSELLMDRRMACLDVRRRELAQLARLLSRPDADIVEHAVEAADGLSPIASCGDLAALTRPIAPPSDLATAVRVTSARQQLADARVLRAAGKYADALALVERLAGDSAASYLPLRAELSYLAGDALGSRSEWDRALPKLEDAIWAAEASGHDEIAMEALGRAAAVLADLDRFKEAHERIRRGEAALLRAGAPPLQWADFRDNVCHVLNSEGRFSAAHDQCRQALELRRRELGSDHPDIANSLFRLGQLAGRFARAGSDEQGLANLRDALAIEERVLGPEHPQVHLTLVTIADVEIRLGRYDDALAHDRRALAIAERSFGGDSIRVARVLWSLGQVLRRQQRNAEAGDIFRRALAITEKAVGPQHSHTAIAHQHVGDALQAQNDYAGALQHYRVAESVLQATVGPTHPNFAIMVLNICSMQLELKHPRQALAACERGLPVLEGAVGRDGPPVADALVGLIARVHAANGRTQDALAALERGIAIWPASDPNAATRIADGELTLAQTLWERGPAERPRARGLARRALHRLTDAGPAAAAQRDTITAWLKSHAR
jgi:tetratricopeptide (TPR) repeat protein